jgi:hypothetical protein
LFVYPDAPDVHTSYRPIRLLGYLRGPVDDLGMIEIARDSESGFEQCMPVPQGDLTAINVGTHVAVCGYLHGNDLLELKHLSMRRFGPVMQFGQVSAIAPFDLSLDRMEAFLIDMRAGPGLSGSPVCTLSPLAVVGVHFAGNAKSVGLALPLGSHRLAVILKAHAEAIRLLANQASAVLAYEVKISLLADGDTHDPTDPGQE